MKNERGMNKLRMRVGWINEEWEREELTNGEWERDEWIIIEWERD